jgi:calcineurin-like phosphoesterase family protein
MTIWFTADPEFDHGNIIRYCNRPFNSLKHMNDEITNRWNSVVTNKDTVYILGDFAYKNELGFAKQLNGEKYLVPGNHDKLKKPQKIGDLIVLPPIYKLRMQSFLDEYGNPRTIVMSHYSMRSWNKSHYASYCLFGHSHGKLEPYGLSFDVGVDCWNYYPISLEQVEKKMQTLKPIIDLRRKPE